MRSKESIQMTWVLPDRLDDRMDAKPFQHSIQQYIEKTFNCGYPTVRLGDETITTFLNRGVNGAIESKTSTRVFKTRHVRNGYIEFESAFFPDPKSQHLGKKKLQKGDVLLTSSGLGTIGRAALFFRDYKSTVDNHVTIIRTTQKIKSGFLVGFLNTKYGVAWSNFGTTGSTGQLELSKDRINEFYIPNPPEKIQDYIGQKVDLAEKCRDIALQSKVQAKIIFEKSINWDCKYESSLLSHWVSLDMLSSRMDLNFNSPRKIRLIEYLKGESINYDSLDSLVSISAMIGWKGLTTEHYVHEGPWLLRGVEYRDGYIDYDALVSVEQYKYDEQPQIHLIHEDIAMTKDGTIGKALVIPKLRKPMAAGSTVARLRIKNKNNLNPYYLEFVINHPVVQIQIQSFATGLAQPHITQEWIAQLLIPRIPFKEGEISSHIARHHYLMEKAHILSQKAKADVEALIEGTLATEAILSGKLKTPSWEEIEKEVVIIHKESKMKERIFISFAIEDERLRDFLVGQARNENSPFDFVDMSVKEPWDSAWKTNCRKKIKGCDGVLIIVTKNTKNADGQLWEINCAKEEGVPRRGIWGSQTDRPSTLPSELNCVHIVNWTWSNIANWIDSL